MDIDQVALVEIDQDGRLLVAPATHEFPFAYREAMKVSWDPATRTLGSPIPREWSYGRWFQQIQAVAFAQGVTLVLGSSTRWVNVPADTQADISEAAAHAA